MNNQHKIINHLGKNIGEQFTMNQLSKALRIPYASFYRTVESSKDVLTTKEIGRAKTLHLNRNNPVLKAHLTIASDEEKREFLKNHHIIRIIAKELDTTEVVVLFGSYAKGKATDKSDIDLLIINKDGKKSLSFRKYEMMHKKEINPIFITKKEFKDMLKDKEENVGKQALKGHIILNNPEKFWELVLDAI